MNNVMVGGFNAKVEKKVAKEIDLIPTNKRGGLKNVAVLNRVNVDNDNKMSRTEMKKNLRKERNNLVRKPTTNLTTVQNRQSNLRSACKIDMQP